MNDIHVKMIEKYACPGCINGCNTECGKFSFMDNYCNSHVAGTIKGGSFQKFLLGLPNGFNRISEDLSVFVFSSIKEQQENFPFDIFNLPVWVSQNGDDLLVKVVIPRITKTLTMVIHNASKEDIVVYNEARHINLEIEGMGEKLDFKPLELKFEDLSKMD